MRPNTDAELTIDLCYILGMEFHPSEEVKAIRSRLDHPVIDGDGHLIEYLPWVRDLVVQFGDASLGEVFDQMVDGGRLSMQVPPEQRRKLGISRTAWWAIPTRNTLDRATAMLPELMYNRLDELGLDFALLYPTYGLVVTGLANDDLRPVLARAFNTYVAQAYEPFRDRLEPVASIPMHTPDEAVEELEHAVNVLGLKSIMMAGVVTRPIEGAEHVRAARWIDTLGHDSPYDYDPVWEACDRLGVAPTFHAGGQGWGTRTSTSNYVYNHIGNFAAAGEAAARSLLLGGVPQRFPNLRFGFQEGGVAWGCNLYSDTLGHFEKRNLASIDHYNPAELDIDALTEHFANYGGTGHAERVDSLGDALGMLSNPDEDPTTIDEFAQSGLSSTDDIYRIFTEQYFFGCEADDPMNAMAFNRELNPANAQLQAIFASDIGHWDVPDFRGVLPEAWELVDDGHLTLADFKAFTFDAAVDLVTAGNPSFFSGTSVESAVADHLA